jgi:antirestriction protein ArdC
MSYRSSRNNGGNATEQRPSLYRTISDRIARDLREGSAPWVRSWSDLGEDPFPRNGLTGREYQGNNVMALFIAAEENDYRSNEWFTYVQAKEAGGQVRGGEHGTRIIKAGKTNPKDEGAEAAREQGQGGTDAKRKRSYMRTYTVFNREQIDGLPEPQASAVQSEAERKGRAQAFIRKTGQRLGRGTIPARFHDLIHTTAARMGRNTATPAHEELTAEIGAALLCAHFCIDGEIRHPEYVANYARAIDGDEATFFRAATAARHAVAYLLDVTGFAPTRDEDSEDDEDGGELDDE